MAELYFEEIMIDKYIQAFSNLRTDKNRNRWSPLTCHQAPHKPFLLMSVMDHFAQGVIAENFIEPSFDLVDTFNIYWSSIMPPGSSTSMAYPFYHMNSEGFWHLDPDKKIPVTSVSKLRKEYKGLSLDDDLYQLMNKPDTREQLRATIINTYFAEEIRPKVIECGTVNIKAFAYSKELLKELKDNKKSWDQIDTDEKKVRDQGFRKAIVTLYEHRCALCGIRMLTPEGHTIVEAAHVKPWSESHNDSPTNGMALCKLCHWSFDEGLMSVGTEYEVLVSKVVTINQNYPGHILTLSDRNIIRPEKIEFWPNKDNLEWHREKVYCR
jgi:putative restriction endonuclease